MRLSRKDRRRCGDIALETGTEPKEVERAVSAFFSTIISDVKRLPFNNPGRIYKPDAFEELCYVTNIPFLGRLGTVYSKYRKWRSEVASDIEMVDASDAKSEYYKPLIEEEARKALRGEKVNVYRLKERVPSGMYRRVWIMRRNGKRSSARQMIVNKKH